ncbi:MAG: SRPBCC family protein [Halobacteriales archaeon]
MTTFNHEIEIDAPIEYVFEWGTTPENWMRSMPALIDLELIEETAEGTHYRNTIKMLGRTTVTDEHYTVDAENFQAVSVFDGGDIRGEMTYDYEETGSATVVRLHGDIETGDSLFDRALQPVVSRYMKRQFQSSLETMKELIEAEYAVEAEDAPIA